MGTQATLLVSAKGSGLVVECLAQAWTRNMPAASYIVPISIVTIIKRPLLELEGGYLNLYYPQRSLLRNVKS